MTPSIWHFAFTLAFLAFASTLPSTVGAECPVYLTQWGALGSGDGQFNSPIGMATDAAGDVYVVDRDNNRIQKFTSTGTYITQWGSLGSGNGQFNHPYGVATDAAGDVYVAEGYTNHRIQKFTSTGTYITQWGSFGSGDGQFHTPIGVATDSFGDVYVTDYYNDRIQKFTSMGTFITKWGSEGSGEGQFDYPHSVTTDPDGNVYVTDIYDRVQKFTGTGTYLTQWGSPGYGDGQFIDPTGVATDAAGNVYVLDIYAGRIEKFTGTGVFLCQWGVNGTGNGQFNQPYGVAIDIAGHVYVSEYGSHRIQKFGPLIPDDVVPPVMACPGDIALPCVPPSGTAVVFSVTATDDQDSAPEVVCTLPSGSVFPVGETVVTCTATDDAGNSASCAFLVTLSSNTDGPSITVPPDVTVVATDGGTACGAVIDDDALGVATASDNCPGPVTVSRTGVPPANFFPAGTTEITYTATDAAGNESSGTQRVIVTEPAGSIAGRALAACPSPGSPLFGLRVDTFDSAGTLVGTTVTDEDGAYVIESLASPGVYTISVVTPLGYQAVNDDLHVAIACGRRQTLDLSFTCLPTAYDPRTIGFWKHQVGVATGGPGNAQVSASELCEYLDSIESHFNGNAINSVEIYEAPPSGLCADKLQEVKRLLNLHGSAAMLARARQQLIALLLNVSAGYVSVGQIVSADGATLSQAITYCDLLVDAPAGDHELAKTIADRINNGQLVAAGRIPLETEDISYRSQPSPIGAPTLGQNRPNPFQGATTIDLALPPTTGYTLSIYSVSGQLVRRYAEKAGSGSAAVNWDGRDEAGTKVAPGIYFYRAQAGDWTSSKCMVLLK